MQGKREQIRLPSGHSSRLLRWTRNLSEVDSVATPNRSERITGEGAHWHYHVEMELTMFTAGEGIRFVGDHIGRFEAGDVVLLGSKLPHYWHTSGLSAGLSVQWSFPSGHAFWSFPETSACSKLFHKAGRGIQYTGGTAAAISDGLHQLTAHSGTGQLGGLLQLLGVMVNASATDQRDLSTRSFILTDSAIHQDAMGEVMRYLIANFRDETRLNEILQLARMSKQTFARQFSKHSGKTFSDFIAQVRLQAACQELVETDRTVMEIAEACGFSHISFFNRVFRRSPTEYRQVKRQRAK